MDYVIKNPIFVNTACDVIRLTLVKENDISTVAEFKIPENGERGINEYWDYILDNFNIDELIAHRRSIEKKYLDERKYVKQKEEAAIEANILKDLFNLKIAVFNYPFVKSASDEDKAAVRRAQDVLVLNMIITKLAHEYMEKNNLTMIQLLDLIDDEVDVI